MPSTLATEELLEENQQQEEGTVQETQAAEKIRMLYKGVRLLKKKTLASSRQASAEQKKTAADAMGTDPARISLSTKLHDKNEPRVKAFRKAIADVNAWFHDPNYTLPWPEPTIRQVKKGKVMLDGEHEVIEDNKRPDGSYEVKFRTFVDGTARVRRIVIDQDEHKTRVQSAFQRFKAEGVRLITIVKREARALAAEMPRIIERQRAKLKNAFNASDYEFDPDACTMEISFPALMPDPELAEIDEESFREERERYERLQIETVRLERQRMAEQMIGWLDGLALALSQRELLDKEYEIISKTATENGWTKIVYKDADRKEAEVELTAADLKRRLSVDDKPRKFNNATASRLFSAVNEAKSRKEELGITSPALDTAITQLQRMLRSENAETLPEALRTDPAFATQVQDRCVAIASSLFESSEIAPRRAIIRKQMQHPKLQGAT